MTYRRQESKFRLILSYMVAVAWGSSFVLDAALRTFDFSPYVHGLMTVVAGYYYYIRKDPPE